MSITRLLATICIILIMPAAACSSAAPSSPDSPMAAQTPSAVPTTTGAHAGSQEPATTSAPSPPPRPAPTAGGLKEELDRAPFDHRDWKTDFTRRSVRLNDFLGGGPPRDGIPAIDEPKFLSVADTDKWLKDPEAVEVVNINGDVRAYPQQVLVWHEIVNDVVGGEPVAVTF